MARTSAEQTLVVADLREQLPVTDAATTSRSLVDNERVRVVAFAFDEGEELTEHTAAPPVVVQVLSGTLRFEVDGEAHRLATGDCVYLPPHKPHSLVALEPSHMSLVMVRDV